MSKSKEAQPTEITTEYLMRMSAPIDPPQQIDNTLMIINVLAGEENWFKGPNIKGKVIAPAGDWMHVMPDKDKNLRLDGRATLETDDGALIYMSYNGVLYQSKESFDRWMKGETLTSKDVLYFITAPTFRTSSDKYALLNHVQCVSKLVKWGNPMIYDVFIVR